MQQSARVGKLESDKRRRIGLPLSFLPPLALPSFVPAPLPPMFAAAAQQPLDPNSALYPCRRRLNARARLERVQTYPP